MARGKGIAARGGQFGFWMFRQRKVWRSHRALRKIQRLERKHVRLHNFLLGRFGFNWRFWRWVSQAIPDLLVYWCILRAISIATTGRYGRSQPMSLSVGILLDRFVKRNYYLVEELRHETIRRLETKDSAPIPFPVPGESQAQRPESGRDIPTGKPPLAG